MGSESKRQVHVLVGGRVQGVGFRAFVRRHARTLGITGFVRNLPGSQVEVTAAGHSQAIDTLLKILSQGPPLSRVDSLKVEEQPVQPFRDFIIRY